MPKRIELNWNLRARAPLFIFFPSTIYISDDYLSRCDISPTFSISRAIRCADDGGRFRAFKTIYRANTYMISAHNFFKREISEFVENCVMSYTPLCRSRDGGNDGRLFHHHHFLSRVRTLYFWYDDSFFYIYVQNAHLSTNDSSSNFFSVSLVVKKRRDHLFPCWKYFSPCFKKEPGMCGSLNQFLSDVCNLGGTGETVKKGRNVCILEDELSRQRLIRSFVLIVVKTKLTMVIVFNFFVYR